MKVSYHEYRTRNFLEKSLTQVSESQTPWLDYSNDRVQAQSLSLAIEAAGPIKGKLVFDLGCGWGHCASVFLD